MNDITPKTFPKYTPNPLLRTIPDYAKDPKNYYAIQKELLEVLASPHSHSELYQSAQCFDCQQKIKERKNVMMKFGFATPAIYYEWHKVMRQMLKLYKKDGK